VKFSSSVKFIFLTGKHLNMVEKRTAEDNEYRPKKLKLIDFHSQSPVSIAEYASVQVFEQTINRVLIMKRVRDNKVNARQILHLANVVYNLNTVTQKETKCSYEETRTNRRFRKDLGWLFYISRLVDQSQRC
jgi:hypothetical protein